MALLAETASTSQEVLGLILTVLGVLSQLLVLWKSVKRHISKPDGKEPEPVLAGGGESRRGPTRSYLDLTFVLICSAFFPCC